MSFSFKFCDLYRLMQQLITGYLKVKMARSIMTSQTLKAVKCNVTSEKSQFTSVAVTLALTLLFT